MPGFKLFNEGPLGVLGVMIDETNSNHDDETVDYFGTLNKLFHISYTTVDRISILCLYQTLKMF